MKFSHIQFKVNELHHAVTDFRKLGFVVEYGKNPKQATNAFIWFGQGAFFEIITMPKTAEKLAYPLGILYGVARCYEFVEKLPDKWETIIGENGRAFSGGGRQRISIARALLKDAHIILLDEATASLDVENETKIQVALSKLIQNKTVMVIAHRMRTVMNDGKVAECGTPKELLEKDGIFTHMVEL